MSAAHEYLADELPIGLAQNFVVVGISLVNLVQGALERRRIELPGHTNHRIMAFLFRLSCQLSSTKSSLMPRQIEELAMR
jgi:hypothetical protein